jgi:hypothetical protein
LDNLPRLATLIRGQLKEVNEDIVGSIMHLKRKHPYDVSWWPFTAVHKPELVVIVSFYQSGLYTDWGRALGSVKHFVSSD